MVHSWRALCTKHTHVRVHPSQEEIEHSQLFGMCVRGGVGSARHCRRRSRSFSAYFLSYAVHQHAFATPTHSLLWRGVTPASFSSASVVYRVSGGLCSIGRGRYHFEAISLLCPHFIVIFTFMFHFPTVLHLPFTNLFPLVHVQDGRCGSHAIKATLNT